MKYEVGQTVILTDVNFRGHKKGRVTKVGRTLVYADADVYGRENTAYRIDSGVKNDSYQHGRIWTVDEWAEVTERTEILEMLKEEGIRLDSPRNVPLERLRKIVEAFK